MENRKTGDKNPLQGEYEEVGLVNFVVDVLCVGGGQGLLSKNDGDMERGTCDAVSALMCLAMSAAFQSSTPKWDSFAPTGETTRASKASVAVEASMERGIRME